MDAGGRLAANSLLGVANSATSVAGPAIAGALIFTVGAGWAFVLDAATFAVSGHGACNFALGMLMTAGPLIAVTELGGKGVWLAALEASAAGYLAGALIAGRARVSRGVLVVDLVLISFAAPLVLFALPAPAWADVTAYGLAAVGLGFANPVWLTAVQQEVPAAALARVSAYDSSRPDPCTVCRERSPGPQIVCFVTISAVQEHDHGIFAGVYDAKLPQ